MKTSVTVTLIFLTLVSIIHLVRFALQVNVTVDEFVVPMWLSLVAFLALGGLAVWLWKDERTS
jgi:membrane protein implicated in regulation of membrane protease activity